MIAITHSKPRHTFIVYSFISNILNTVNNFQLTLNYKSMVCESILVRTKTYYLCFKDRINNKHVYFRLKLKKTKIHLKPI